MLEKTKKSRKTIENQLFYKTVLGRQNASFENPCEENGPFYLIRGWQNFSRTRKRKICQFSEEKIKNKKKNAPRSGALYPYFDSGSDHVKWPMLWPILVWYHGYCHFYCSIISYLWPWGMTGAMLLRCPMVWAMSSPLRRLLSAFPLPIIAFFIPIVALSLPMFSLRAKKKKKNATPIG